MKKPNEFYEILATIANAPGIESDSVRNHKAVVQILESDYEMPTHFFHDLFDFSQTLKDVGGVNLAYKYASKIAAYMICKYAASEIETFCKNDHTRQF